MPSPEEKQTISSQPPPETEPASVMADKKPATSEANETSKGPQLLSTFGTNRSKIIRGLLICLVGFLLFCCLQFIRSRNLYAVVDGRAISKQTFAQAKTANQNYAQKASLVPQTLKDVDTYTRNQLLLDAVLQKEADKAKVTVSKVEIDSQLLHIGLKDGKTVDGREGYKKGLGWSDADVDRYGRIPVLEAKLVSSQLKYLEIFQIVTYWSEIPGMTLAEAETLAKQTVTDKAEPLFKNHKPTYEIFASMNSLNGSAQPFTPTFLNISRLMLPDAAQAGEVQAAAIKKLNKVGDYTPVSRGDAAFYFIDRLEGKGTGSYKSWEDLTAAANKRAKIYKGSFDLRRLTLGFKLK